MANIKFQEYGWNKALETGQEYHISKDFTVKIVTEDIHDAGFVSVKYKGKRILDVYHYSQEIYFNLDQLNYRMKNFINDILKKLELKINIVRNNNMWFVLHNQEFNLLINNQCVIKL